MVHKTVCEVPRFIATQTSLFHKHEYNDSSMLLQNDFLCWVQSMSDVLNGPGPCSIPHSVPGWLKFFMHPDVPQPSYA